MLPWLKALFISARSKSRVRSVKMGRLDAHAQVAM